MTLYEKVVHYGLEKYYKGETTDSLSFLMRYFNNYPSDIIMLVEDSPYLSLNLSSRLSNVLSDKQKEEIFSKSKSALSNFTINSDDDLYIHRISDHLVSACFLSDEEIFSKIFASVVDKFDIYKDQNTLTLLLNNCVYLIKCMKHSKQTSSFAFFVNNICSGSVETNILHILYSAKKSWGIISDEQILPFSKIFSDFVLSGKFAIAWAYKKMFFRFSISKSGISSDNIVKSILSNYNETELIRGIRILEEYFLEQSDYEEEGFFRFVDCINRHKEFNNLPDYSRLIDVYIFLRHIYFHPESIKDKLYLFNQCPKSLRANILFRLKKYLEKAFLSAFYYEIDAVFVLLEAISDDNPYNTTYLSDRQYSQALSGLSYETRRFNINFELIENSLSTLKADDDFVEKTLYVYFNTPLRNWVSILHLFFFLRIEKYCILNKRIPGKTYGTIHEYNSRAILKNTFYGYSRYNKYNQKNLYTNCYSVSSYEDDRPLVFFDINQIGWILQLEPSPQIPYRITKITVRTNDNSEVESDLSYNYRCKIDCNLLLKTMLSTWNPNYNWEKCRIYFPNPLLFPPRGIKSSLEYAEYLRDIKIDYAFIIIDRLLYLISNDNITSQHFGPVEYLQGLHNMKFSENNVLFLYPPSKEKIRLPKISFSGSQITRMEALKEKLLCSVDIYARIYIYFNTIIRFYFSLSQMLKPEESGTVFPDSSLVGEIILDGFINRFNCVTLFQYFYKRNREKKNQSANQDIFYISKDSTQFHREDERCKFRIVSYIYDKDNDTHSFIMEAV